MSYKILIVDDSAVTRAVLKKTLGMIDLSIKEIVQAENGKAALEIVNSQPVDLVLADLNMPQMNGVEMAAQILQNENTKHIPIVIITTEASCARIEDLKQKGVKGYIHKPFSPEQVRETLLEVLGIHDA